MIINTVGLSEWWLTGIALLHVCSSFYTQKSPHQTSTQNMRQEKRESSCQKPVYTEGQRISAADTRPEGEMKILYMLTAT